jgi:gluconolactonase
MSAPTLLAQGLGFTEGPLWHPEEGLLLVGLSRGLVWRVEPTSGEASIFANAGGRPNGLAADRKGAVWIAQAGKGDVPPSIQCVQDGVVRTVLARGFHAPNDLCFGPDGRLWFTDPAGHALEGQTPLGRIWAYDPQRETLDLMLEAVRYPNGLAFSSDGSVLFVAETARARIVRCQLQEGRLSAPQTFADLTQGVPDGIALDSEGRLYVAALNGHSVAIFDSNGVEVERIPFEQGSLPTNLCFGGPHLRTLFVTAAKGGSLYHLRRDVGGLVL